MGGDSDPVSDVLKSVENVVSGAGKAVGDTINTGAKGVSDIAGQVGRLDKIILSPTNAAEEDAKAAAKADQAQREQAVRDQNEAESNLRKQQASNVDASKGSSIILGKKGKKGKKGSSVSSGMGLSKGKTGLQT